MKVTEKVVSLGKFTSPLELPSAATRLLSWPLQAANVTLWLASVALFAIRLPSLPAVVPVRFSFSGGVREWGAASSLWSFAWMMFVNALLPVLVYLWVRRERWALPVTAVEEAAQLRVVGLQIERRRLIVRLVEWCALCQGVFLGSMWLLATQTQQPGPAMFNWNVVLRVGVLTLAMIVVLGWFARALLRVRRELLALGAAPALGTRSSGWYAWGTIYYAPSDHAVFVPKRSGLGLTVNFARAEAWAVLVALVILPLLPVLLLR